MNKKMLKKVALWVGAITGLSLGLVAIAAASGAAPAAAAATGVGAVAANISSNLGGIAKLVTGGSYVAGMAFAVGAIVKFKAHKDNPTQIAISMPITLLFVGAALIFIPSVFTSSGATLFGTGAKASSVSGLTTFGSGAAS